MKLNRIGAALIAGALAVIALVVTLLIMRQQDSRVAEVRAKGVSLARSLSTVPVALLNRSMPGLDVLSTMFAYQDNGDLAYAAVTDADGRTVADVARRGTLIPSAPLPGEAATTFGERSLAGGAGGRALIEFYGPLADRGKGQALVRIGFYRPGYAVLARDVSFLALLALMMFLLVPVVYLVVKREMAPLDALGRQLRELGDAHAVSVDTAGDVRRLVHGMQSYLSYASTRIAQLESGALSATADNRVLQYGSRKLEAALQSLPDGLLMLAPGGEVSFASDKVEPLLGVPVQQILEQPVASWCRDPALRALLGRYADGQREALNGHGATAHGVGHHGVAHHSVDFVPVNVDGKYLSATVQPLAGGHGAMSFGTLVVLRDVTREQLARQAGNDFVAHVSHELKSPLNVIGMYAETLADAGDEALRVESLNVIQDEIERMNALVGNLLNVSKLETGSMSPERNRVRLDDLLRDAYDHALPRAEGKNLRLSLDLPRELEAVSIDKDLFRIVLNNLLTNAIKYNRPGGSVLLSARNEDHEIVISVRDTGIGIGSADQERVFEKFYRADESGGTARGGHGLGLYLAAQIVELHHGRLTLDSEPGIGSTFSIHLNIAPAAAGIVSL